MKFRTSLRFLLSLTLMISAASVWASDGYYSERPEVLSLNKISHPELGPTWTKMKNGQLEAVAQMIEMYADREIYFLARDSELLYDLAKVLTQDEPALSRRLHLLNISRISVEADYLHEYLNQEGLSVKALEDGKKIVLVDSGFRGSIPQAIAKGFPEYLTPQIQTHLLSSANSNFPSSRVFLNALSEKALTEYPDKLSNELLIYENLPHYTPRSEKFEKVNGRWQPTHAITINAEEEGFVSKETATQYMEDIRDYGSRKETRAIFTKRRQQWKELRSLADDQTLSKAELVGRLKTILQKNQNDSMVEAAVKDFLDLKQTNFYEGPKVFGRDLGFKGWNSNAGTSTYLIFRDRLAKKFPQWAEEIEDPSTTIQKMIEKRQYTRISAVNEAIGSLGFSDELAKKLGSAKNKPLARNFLTMSIKKDGPKGALRYATYTFKPENAVNLKQELITLIEIAPPEAQRKLVENLFSRPYSAELDSVLAKLVNKGEVNETLHQLVFSKPHFKIHHSSDDCLQSILKSAINPH